MSYSWYAVQSEVLSKEAFLAELRNYGYKDESKIVKDILIFEFKQDILNLDTDSSLLAGYVLLNIKNSNLKEIVQTIKSKHIGTFFNLGSNGLPYPVPDSEVAEFKKKVKSKKTDIKIGNKVKILEGVLNGFNGKVVKKKDLMVEVSVKLTNRTIKRWVAIPHITKDLKE